MEKQSFYMSTKEIKDMTNENMSGSWGYCAKVTTLYLIFNLVVIGLVLGLSLNNPSWYVILLSCLVGSLVLYLFYYGYEIFCLNLNSKMKASTKDIFAGFSKKTFKLIKTFFLRFFMLVIGLCCFVVYGYVFLLKYSMSCFVLNQNSELTAKDCLKQSKRLMKENNVRLFKLQFSNIGWYILCLTVVGAVWALPYIKSAKVIFYNDLKTDF